ncbi:hypothetical protein F4804DRAFT_352725 [Jackrogersella minutella]|nr:hypothetical protein F4804DRAFT_352725 [Jackrogersella minutella]
MRNKLNTVEGTLDDEQDIEKTTKTISDITEPDITTKSSYVEEELLDDSDIDQEDWLEVLENLDEELTRQDAQHNLETDLGSPTDGILEQEKQLETLSMLTSSAFFTFREDQADDAQKALFVQQSLQTELQKDQPSTQHTQEPGISEQLSSITSSVPNSAQDTVPASNDGNTTYGITEHKTTKGQPYLKVSLGNRFMDVRDPHYFASTFIKILPYGWGGPVASNSDQRRQMEENSETNFGLKTWASIKLRQHGGFAATHPIFPFLVFNRLMKNNSARISKAQVKKSSFAQIRRISESITQQQLLLASEELKQHRPISNPDMQKLLKEISIFGKQQPLSNEEKVNQRNMIKSLIVKHGLPAIWFTINPNDLSSPIRIITDPDNR